MWFTIVQGRITLIDDAGSVLKGQKVAASSLPVVIASDQTVPISAASLPLPTGAATEATLATLLTEAEFETRIPAQGQAEMAASVPVVVASDQSLLEATLKDQDGFDAIADLRLLMGRVLTELRIMNLHLTHITGQHLRPGDEQ